MNNVQVTYRFTRAPGHLGRNRASTDALTVLERWSAGSPSRSYEVIYDEDSQERLDDQLVARLRTSQQDVDANRGILDELCHQGRLLRELAP